MSEVRLTDDRDKSPRRGMAAAILFLQAIVFGLTTPVMISQPKVASSAARRLTSS